MKPDRGKREVKRVVDSMVSTNISKTVSEEVTAYQQGPNVLVSNITKIKGVFSILSFLVNVILLTTLYLNFDIYVTYPAE